MQSERFPGSDDIGAFQCATRILVDARVDLAHRIEECEVAVNSSEQLLVLLYTAPYLNVATSVTDALRIYYLEQGFESPSKNLATALSEEDALLAKSVVLEANLADQDLADSLATFHWLMEQGLGEGIVQALQRFLPGTMLADKQGRYWIRCAAMAVTHHRFISPVGDDQEKYYTSRSIFSPSASLTKTRLSNTRQILGWSCVPVKACAILTQMLSPASSLPLHVASASSLCEHSPKCTWSTASSPTTRLIPFFLTYPY